MDAHALVGWWRRWRRSIGHPRRNILHRRQCRPQQQLLLRLLLLRRNGGGADDLDCCTREHTFFSFGFGFGEGVVMV